MAEALPKGNIMAQLKQLALGNFIYENESVDHRMIQSFLGIPYAKAERFGLPEMIDTYQNSPANSAVGLRFPQNDVPPLLNFFLKK